MPILTWKTLPSLPVTKKKKKQGGKTRGKGGKSKSSKPLFPVFFFPFLFSGISSLDGGDVVARKVGKKWRRGEKKGGGGGKVGGFKDKEIERHFFLLVFFLTKKTGEKESFG